MQGNIPIIILAAGSSSRLGQPKQLLLNNGETLLNNTIKIAKNVSEEVLVILGANAEKIAKSIHQPRVQIQINKNWEEGMASSIRLGISHFSDSEAVIILLVDQIMLTVEVLVSILNKYTETNCDFVASKYMGVVGVPIIFKNSVFDKLLSLTGEIGAKAILKTLNKNYKIETIDFEGGEIDIDVIADLALLK